MSSKRCVRCKRPVVACTGGWKHGPSTREQESIHRRPPDCWALVDEDMIEDGPSILVFDRGGTAAFALSFSGENDTPLGACVILADDALTALSISYKQNIQPQPKTESILITSMDEDELDDTCLRPGKFYDDKELHRVGYESYSLDEIANRLRQNP